MASIDPASLLLLAPGADTAGDDLYRQILPEAVDLVHAFVKDGGDANAAVGQGSPVDIVVLVPAEKAVHAIFGRDGAPRNSAGGDGGEAGEQAPDVAGGLFLAPQFSGVDVDFIQAMPGPF